MEWNSRNPRPSPRGVQRATGSFLSTACPLVSSKGSGTYHNHIVNQRLYCVQRTSEPWDLQVQIIFHSSFKCLSSGRCPWPRGLFLGLLQSLTFCVTPFGSRNDSKAAASPKLSPARVTAHRRRKRTLHNPQGAQQWELS